MAVVTSNLRLRGDLTARADSNLTQIVPRLISGFTVASKINLEARYDFVEWNAHSALSDGAAEIKFRIGSVFPAIDAIEGSTWHGPQGLVRNRLHLALRRDFNSGLGVESVTLRASATVEESRPQGLPESAAAQLEAALSGFGMGVADGHLILRYRAQLGEPEEKIGSILFGSSWAVSALTQLNLNCELTETPSGEQRSIALSWRVKF